MHRVFIPQLDAPGDQITIDDPRDVHHLVRVLRVKPEEPIECFDGQGRTYRGRITHAGSRQLIVAVDQCSEEPAPRIKLTLAQSLIQPARFDWTLQKVTELGVARLTPVITSRTTVRSAARDVGRRVERWRRIVQEAAAQSGRARLPVVDEPLPFEDVLQTLSSRYALLPTLVERGSPLAEHVRRLTRASEIVVLIGPEGDFTPEEVALARRAGAHPVSLGKATLRSETAAIAALAILQHALGQL